MKVERRGWAKSSIIYFNRLKGWTVVSCYTSSQYSKSEQGPQEDDLKKILGIHWCSWIRIIPWQIYCLGCCVSGLLNTTNIAVLGGRRRGEKDDVLWWIWGYSNIWLPTKNHLHHREFWTVSPRYPPAIPVIDLIDGLVDLTDQVRC